MFVFLLIVRSKFKQWLLTLSKDLLDLSGYVLFSFTSVSELSDTDSDKDSQALTLFHRCPDQDGFGECRLLVAGRNVPCTSSETALKLELSLHGDRFLLPTEEEGEAWKPNRCMHVSSPMAGMVYLDLLGATWGPKLRAIPYITAGMQLRSQLEDRLPTNSSAAGFDDVCDWLDRFQVDVQQIGYFGRSWEHLPERQKKYITPEKRTTRETLETQGSRTFPISETRKRIGKSIDISAFRFKPLQDGIKIDIDHINVCFEFVKETKAL